MIRSKHTNPSRISFAIRGSPAAGWTSSALGVAGVQTFQHSPNHRPGREVRRKDGRIDDGLPNPQAFSLPTIQTYPDRTATCRQCPELRLSKCSRASCDKLSLGHAFILNAIADGNCPLGLFTQEL